MNSVPEPTNKRFAQQWYAPVLVALGTVALLLILATVAVVLFFRAYVLPTARTLMHDPTKIVSLMSGGKMIDLAIYNTDGRVDRHLPALNGYSQGYSNGYGYSAAGSSTTSHLDDQYKVTADASGHFQVSIRRSVEVNGARTIAEIILPVWPTEPSADKRVKLPDGSTVVAFLLTPPR